MKKSNIFLLIIFFAFSLWPFWLGGERVANDYHVAQQELQIANGFPFIWREIGVADGLGEYTGITLWSQLIHSYSALLAFFSIPFWVQTKIVLIIILTLGALSIYKLLDYLKMSFGKYIGTIFYLTNTYFLLLIDGGQLSLGLAYVIFPLALYFFFKIYDSPVVKNRINLALSILAISMFDIRFIYILMIVFSIYFFVKLLTSTEKTKILRNTIMTGSFCGVLLLGIHSFWIIPAILKPPQLPQTYDRAVQVDFLSFSSIGHSLLFQQPHWYKNIFGQIDGLKVEFIVIPLLAFFAPILKIKNKVVGFWLLVSVIGIFLTKGSNEPLEQIYSWLFSNIPGFSLFRDPSKFYILVALGYTVLISITIDKIMSLKGNKYLTKFYRVTPFLFLIYLLWLMRPIYLTQMTGLFSSPIHLEENYKLEKYLKNGSDYSRVFWIPTKSSLGYVSEQHPAVEAARLSQKRPFASGIKGSYETFNFLREASYMGEIFDIAGIGYIVYPYLDQRRDDMHPDNIRYYDLFLDQLSKLPWLSKVENTGIPLLKVNTHQDRFFIPPNLWWVIGSDSIYSEATKSAELSLSRNALIFAEEYSGLGQKIDQYPNAKIVLNDKTLLDLAGSFIESSKLIFPARQLDFEPNQIGWWKREAVDLSRWRDFLVNKYGFDNQDFDLGGGWAVGEGEKELKIELVNLTEGDILLARVLESTRSGELKFYQNGQLIGTITTESKKSNVRWFEVGDMLTNGSSINIKSFGDINVVNALAILNKDIWLSFKERAGQLTSRIVEFSESNATNLSIPKVTYQKINPTKYLVNINGLREEKLLVFSQNYDGLWKMEGESPLLIYSLLNGFKVNKDGQYLIEFEAQKYVNFGLIVTGFTILFIFYFLIKYSKKR